MYFIYIPILYALKQIIKRIRFFFLLKINPFSISHGSHSPHDPRNYSVKFAICKIANLKLRPPLNWSIKHNIYTLLTWNIIYTWLTHMVLYIIGITLCYLVVSFYTYVGNSSYGKKSFLFMLILFSSKNILRLGMIFRFYLISVLWNLKSQS